MEQVMTLMVYGIDCNIMRYPFWRLTGETGNPLAFNNSPPARADGKKSYGSGFRYVIP